MHSRSTTRRLLAPAFVWLLLASRVLEAQTPTIVASPTITQATGIVTITYRDVIINHPLRDDGPTLAQIRAAVQRVVDQKATRSTRELRVAIEAQLDRLDRITAELGEMRQQITQLGTSSEDNHAAISEGLARIAELIERGHMEEARSRLDDLHDLTRPGRSISLRVFAATNLGGYRVRALTGTILRCYDLAIWPENVGAGSLSVGLGVSYGLGTARGGFAAPSPDHPIISPIEFSSSYVAAVGAATLAMRRTRPVNLLAAFEIELGMRTYYPNDGPAEITSSVALTRLSIAAATSVSRLAFAAISLSFGYEPWEKRPVYVYTGVGADYDEPMSSGGIHAGFALSVNLRK